jgi:hypothetical protein
MAIIFGAPQNYAWAVPSPRPAKPVNFSLEVLATFLETDYARNTTLANFLRANPNAAINGVLNQLHRRHIISWDTIKAFMAKAARTNHNHQTFTTVEPVAYWFNIIQEYRTAADTAHGFLRAAAFTNLANSVCWRIKNVWVGPSAGNIGVDIDVGNDLNDFERRDMLLGTPWRGADIIQGIMDGFANA